MHERSNCLIKPGSIASCKEIVIENFNFLIESSRSIADQSRNERELGLKIKAEIIANNDGMRRKVINKEIKGDFDEVVSGEKRKRLFVERFNECMITKQ